eukprot:1396056-Amphidinium_carterae.2
MRLCKPIRNHVMAQRSRQIPWEDLRRALPFGEDMVPFAARLPIGKQCHPVFIQIMRSTLITDVRKS